MPAGPLRRRTRSSNSFTRTSAPAPALPWTTPQWLGQGSAAVHRQRNRSGRLRQAAGSGDGTTGPGATARCGSPAWDLPTVFGPIAVTYNLDGVIALNLDGPTTAKIFNGTITTWNDPAIKALNTDVKLPSRRSRWCSVTTNPVPPTTSRSISMPRPTARGVKEPTRRSTAASARAPSGNKGVSAALRAPKGRSPTTNGRLRWVTS